MKSELPITGTCHFCGKPCEGRFCGHNCNNSYHYRKQHPEIQRASQNNDTRYTEKRRTKAEEEAAIERVVQKARDNGTLGWATLAPQAA